MAASGDRISWLRAEIARHDHLYWQALEPELSDAEYDSLVAEWEERTGTPWQPVREEIAGSKRIAHLTPMLSLEKLHTEEDWQGFLRRLQHHTDSPPDLFRLEPKYDGVAVSLVYEDGILAHALTRGDGQYGRIITANLLRTTAIPRKIPPHFGGGNVEIRGELYADQFQFDAINRWRVESDESAYTLPRHLVAAFMRIVDTVTLPPDSLSFVAFDIRGGKDPGAFHHQSDSTRFLEKWEFATPHPVWPRVPLHAVMDRIQEFGSLRTKLDFPTDGLVIKVENRNLQQRAGSTARAPRWAAAWKYPGETVTSEIIRIVESIGETGRITPVAEIRPIQIDGVTVRRVSLHSPRFVEKHGLRPGKAIRVHLGGGIVPAFLPERGNDLPP